MWRRRLGHWLGRVPTRRHSGSAFCYQCVVVTLRRAIVELRRISSVQENLGEPRWHFVVSSNDIVFVVRRRGRLRK